jgi:hypothetical protein
VSVSSGRAVSACIDVCCDGIVTCMSDCRRGLDWGIDLLTTYRSELQITITLLLTPTLQITPR